MRQSDKEEKKKESLVSYLPNALTSSLNENEEKDADEGGAEKESQKDYEFTENGLPVIYASSLREAYSKIDYYKASSGIAPEVRRKFNEKFSEEHTEGKVMFELKGTSYHCDGIKEYSTSIDECDKEEVIERNSKTLHSEMLSEPRYALRKKRDDEFLSEAQDLLDVYSHQFGNAWLESAIRYLPELGDAYDLLSAITGETSLGGEKQDKLDRAITMVGIVPLTAAAGKVVRVKRNNTTFFIAESLYMEACMKPEQVVTKYREQSIEYLKRLWSTMETFLKELPNESRHHGFYGEPSYHKSIKGKRRRSFR